MPVQQQQSRHWQRPWPQQSPVSEWDLSLRQPAGGHLHCRARAQNVAMPGKAPPAGMHPNLTGRTVGRSASWSIPGTIRAHLLPAAPWHTFLWQGMRLPAAHLAAALKLVRVTALVDAASCIKILLSHLHCYERSPHIHESAQPVELS